LTTWNFSTPRTLWITFYNMFKILRIVCCIIAALFVAACPFVFIYAGNVWGMCCLLAAFIFAVLTFLFRTFSPVDEEEGSRKSSPPSDPYSGLGDTDKANFNNAADSSAPDNSNHNNPPD